MSLNPPSKAYTVIKGRGFGGLTSQYQHLFSHRAEKDQEEISAVTCIKSNSNYFFKYAKKHSHTNSHLGPLLNELSELTNDVPEMCNLLLNQYNSVFSTPCREKDITNLEEFFNVEDSNGNDILSDIIINQSMICDAINEMSSSSASAILFKECRDELSIPLQNHSLRTI